MTVTALLKIVILIFLLLNTILTKLKKEIVAESYLICLVSKTSIFQPVPDFTSVLWETTINWVEVNKNLVTPGSWVAGTRRRSSHVASGLSAV